MNSPLRAYRQRQSISQAELAERLGVSTAAVSRWEAGKRKIDDHLVATVEKITGISARRLRPDLAELLG